MTRTKRWWLALALALGCDAARSQPDPHAGHVAAASPPAEANHAGHDAHAGHAMPAGYAEVELDTGRQQLVGLRTAVAERSVLAAPVRATAILAIEQDREAHVHSRLDGWVQKLYVEKIGQLVKRGQPLYAIYSQQAYAAQLEYLRARKFSPELAEAARERLGQWAIADDQLARIEREGATRKLVIRAPITGTVIDKGLVEGHYVDPGQMLFHIVDLTELWVLAEVYAYEVDRIDPHGTAVVWIEGAAEPLRLPVDYVYPTVDPMTRTVQVRMRLPNPSARWRPQSFATVELPTRPLEALSVPDEAVIDTGVRQVVYLALDEGRFRPTVVHVGRRVDGRAEILHGLTVGDRVVTSAQFLLDSESRLRGQAAPAHAGHG